MWPLLLVVPTDPSNPPPPPSHFKKLHSCKYLPFQPNDTFSMILFHLDFKNIFRMPLIFCLLKLGGVFPEVEDMPFESLYRDTLTL